MVSLPNCAMEPKLDRAVRAHTLCFVQDGSRVLLGMKKKGFGVGKWNGFGGKMEEGESIGDAARRELREEAGIDVQVLEHAGIFTEVFGDDPTIREIHVFRASGVIGEVVETDEMRPQWFMADAIPYHAMWKSDVLWFERFLRGESFRAHFVFSDPETLVESSVEGALE